MGNNSIVFAGMLSHSLFNAYQLALVDGQTPEHRPILVLTGQAAESDYRARSYEMLSDNVLTQTSETLVPNNCGASIPQIAAADLFGTKTQEIILDRLCDPVPIYTVGPGGALTLYETQSIVESLEVIGTRQTPVHSGAIVIGDLPHTVQSQRKNFRSRAPVNRKELALRDIDFDGSKGGGQLAPAVIGGIVLRSGTFALK